MTRDWWGALLCTVLGQHVWLLSLQPPELEAWAYYYCERCATTKPVSNEELLMWRLNREAQDR